MIAEIKKRLPSLVAEANFSLRGDVLKLLKQAEKKEKNKSAKKALSWILENADIAKKEQLAICQDTGLPIVFIEAGRGTKLNSDLIEVIKKGVEVGYSKNKLRTSIVDPLLRKNPSYKGVICHLDFVTKLSGLRITLLPKGFGCENKSQLKMFNPTVNLSQVEDFVVETVVSAGPEACPPFVIGVGIGGTSDQALVLAKKALLGPVDKPNIDKKLNQLEKRLLKKVNALNIGPMGFGGKTTALAVKINKAPTHIAGLPVGVNISCHALRRASFKIK